MGMTYVYNTGKAEVEKKNLQVTFGVFIDGTLNSKENTKLRYKVEGTVDPLLEKGERQQPASAGEKKTYHDNTHTSAVGDWVLRQLDLGGYYDNSSYANDYTNVARLWFCTQKAYKVYIEGMGTDDFKKDATDGFAFGSGLTGIRAKVRKGCEKLAEKIIKEISNEDSKKLTQITVDLFGFSRGAASARNMAYEIRKKAYPAKQISIPDGYYPPNPYSESGMPTPKFKTAQVDKDGLEIDSSMLVDGKLPKYGYLGYCLLKKITIEELEQITIVVRCLGLYDTVSSYYEGGDSLGTYEQDGTIVDEGLGWKGVKKTAKDQFASLSPFANNEDELNLHDFGYVQKLIHFTAQNEHRENFSLTRVKGANLIDRIVEKNFPGVHCDIGGAYPTGYEEKIKIAEQYVLGNILKSIVGVTELELYKNELINQYWFKEDQIWTSSTLTKIILTSKRYLKKEYSYIPLHFMETHCRQTQMTDYYIDKTEGKFSIDGDEILVDVKKHLKPYVLNEEGAKEWTFINDEELKKRKKEREEKAVQERMMMQVEEDLKKPTLPRESVYDNLDPSKFEPDVIELDFPEKKEKKEKDPIMLDEVIVIANSPQTLLRKLRNEYLHWSADCAGVGMDARKDRKREEFPKM
jgi:hypothetical protein